MADVCYCKDALEDSDGAYGEDSGITHPDDLLSPVLKLEKYANSDDVFNRQIVARTVLETLRVASDDTEGVAAVLNVMSKLADDPEPTVRAELMEQVPHIAMYCQDVRAKLSLVVPHNLLPMVVKFLTDANNQVRKTSQAALLVLLEQGLVERSDVQEQVCPVILRLTKQGPTDMPQKRESIDECRTEAVALLSKMAPLVGREMTEELFLDRFAILCGDALLNVRQVCAANFGEFATVVGTKSTEQVLLKKFFSLCQDTVWGVRKACAEIFMQVSCVCSLQIRQKCLSLVFIELLRDQSRWVRMAAFQSLGLFISTFADSSITSLLQDDNGEMIITNPGQLSERLNELEEKRAEVAEVAEDKATVPVLQLPPGTNSDPNTGNGESRTISCSSRDAETGRDPTDPEQLPDAAAVALNVVSSFSEEPGKNEPSETADGVGDDGEDLEKDGRPANPVSYRQLDCDGSISVISSGENDREENGEDIEVSTEDFEKLTAETEPSPGGSPSSPSSSPDKTPAEIFNHFQFWREPVPEIKVDDDHDDAPNCCYSLEDEDIDAQVVSCLTGMVPSSAEKAQASSSSASTDDRVDKQKSDSTILREEKGEEEDEDIELMIGPLTSESEDVRETEIEVEFGDSSDDYVSLVSNETKQTFSSKDRTLDTALPRGPPSVEQDIVPQLLVDHYVSMIDPSRVQTVDNEIARHCAYSLPAVALTLGRANWPLLKDTYETLASDMQWKVRRTLASSIHQLGMILGEEAAAKDLIPVFNGFLKDLDEVRIGLLKHLMDFLKLLKPEDRRDYLPRLSGFLKMDNERNWRFRQELADQLGHLVPLFVPEEVQQHLSPIAVVLIRDKVAAVRISSVTVCTAILRYLQKSDNPNLVRELLDELAGKLARDSRWVNRQTYAKVALQAFTSCVVDEPVYSGYVLPHLLDLASDRVPNVRLCAARALHSLNQSIYFSSGSNVDHQKLDETLSALSVDKDSDVRGILSATAETSTEYFDSDGEPVADVSSLPV